MPRLRGKEDRQDVARVVGMQGNKQIERFVGEYVIREGFTLNAQVEWYQSNVGLWQSKFERK